MQIPQIRTRAFDQPTATAVTVGDVELAFSYDTLVAFRTPGRPWKVRTNVWSNTTGRTLNALDGGGKEAKAARLSETDFLHDLEAATS